MKTRRTSRLAAIAVTLWMLAPGARGELVSCDAAEPCVCQLYQQGDTPDPFPWGRVLPEHRGFPLNADGDLRGDGWPDFGINLAARRVEVVWSYNTGDDREIAWSTTGGGPWSPITFLTDNGTDDLDPVIAFSPATGGTKVAWWSRDRAAEVVMAETGSPASEWGPPQRLSAGNLDARRPAILISSGKVFVAWEQESPLGGRDIVVAERADVPVPGDPFVPTVLAHTDSPQPLFLTIEATVTGSIWVGWFDSATEIGYSVYDGSSWSLPIYTAYDGAPEPGVVRVQIIDVLTRGL